MLLFQAIIIGLFAAFIRTHELSTWVIYCSPLACSSIIGAILGNYELGVAIGAQLQLVYMGALVVGGVSSYSYIWAGVIGPAICIVSGLDPVESATVCVTVGALGVISDNIRMTVNANFVHMADKYVQTGETKLLWVYDLLLPFLLYCVIYGIPAVIGIMLGANYLAGIMQSLPIQVTNAITAIGKLLPALGIGMMLKAVYNKKLIAFLIVGYVLSGYLGLPTLGVALIGIACTLVYYNSLNRKGGEA